MNSQQHEPLFTDDEILSLLTPSSAVPPLQNTPRPLLQRPSFYVGGAALAVAGVATVYMLNTVDPQVPSVSPVRDEVELLQAPAPQPIPTEDLVRKVSTAPLITALTTPSSELAELGLFSNTNKVWFVEDGQRVTISAAGISLKPTTEEDIQKTPVAVTLYDDQGAYGSWYDPRMGAPSMNDLVPVRVVLETSESHLHQNVVALLWYAPTEAKLIEPQIVRYQEHRDVLPGIRIEKIFPNPVRGDVATLEISSEQTATASISIMDVSGRLLATITGTQVISRGTTTVRLNELQSLPSGMVIVVIDLPELGSRLVQRLLIQR